MLDLTVGQVRFIGQPVAIVTGGAITSALGLTDPARRATAAAPAMAAASDAGEGARHRRASRGRAVPGCARSTWSSYLWARRRRRREEHSRAVQAARDASAQLGAALRHEELRAQLVSGDGAAAVAEEEAAAAAEAAVEAAAVAVGAATAAVAGTR